MSLRRLLCVLVSLPHGARDWPVNRDCDISWPYLLEFLVFVLVLLFLQGKVSVVEVTRAM